MAPYRDMIRFIWRLARPQKWTFVCIFILDALAWPLDFLLWPYFLHLVFDIFSLYEGNRAGAWEPLQGPLIGILLLVLFVEIASRTMGLLFGKAVPTLQATIRMTMFDHIQRHSPHYFHKKLSGSLANQITDMTTQVETILNQLFFPIVPAFVASLLAPVFLWGVHPIFSWILFIWVVIHLAISLKCARSCDRLEHQHAKARTTLVGKIVDSLANHFTVNLFYRFKSEKERLNVFQKEEKETHIRSKWHVEKMRLAMAIVFILGHILAIFGTLIYLWLHNQMTTGQAIQVLTTAMALSSIMWMVGPALPIVFQSFGIVKQAYRVMQDPQDVEDQATATPLRIFSGEIRFQNVSFRYGSENIFTHQYVHIRGGEKVGLVGFSGSGKSTFINLILRFLIPQEGHILIDGQDIAQVTLKSLRRQIALIPQDPLLFHRTLHENICYGKPDASQKEIQAATTLAHCAPFIEKMAKKYEAKVGDKGAKLSGGEKQRIAIARAILTEAPILILDEATSALDSVTERYIQDSLDQIMQNRTTIVIAHRLSTLSRMDRILVFNRGKIVEDGTHLDLLNKQGLYTRMWEMQVGGFLPETSTE